ncbi:MAG: signal peptidase I [Actinomycetes bacterium]
MVAVAISLVLRAFVVQAFVIPTASMQPLLQPGDRVLAWRLPAFTGDVRRGDVVVFDGSGVFAESGDFAKRVVGVEGDRVACCTPDGQVTVDGEPLAEPYLYPGDRPSEVRFDVVVPPGRLWVMGDHRSVSADSRAYLGRPGGGMVPEERVIGRVVGVLWPPGRAGVLDRAAADGTAAPGTQARGRTS